jgi:glycosyltransferase involved in cell wall biosynthesis
MERMSVRDGRPLVSVVIPAFNGERFIAEAVSSIRNQTLKAFEIIVVDDGSTDGTGRAVARLGNDIRYHAQTNRGPAAARNRGVRAAAGTLIAFLDQDDLWPPDHLAVLLTALDHAPADVAMGLTQALLPDGSAHAVFEPFARAWRAPHVGSALFRRAAFETMGPFDERLRACSDDLDWFMRARERGVPIVLVDAVTYLFRIHAANTSRDAEFRRRALLEAVTASVRRRRGGGDA